MVISASHLLIELQRTLGRIIKDSITNTKLQRMLGGIIKDSITNTQSVTVHGNKCQ